MRVSAETKNATRKRILEVAQKQFAQRGFEATTTRDIARAAEIAAGTLFNYFPTKEAIVEYLVGNACAGATEAFAAAVEGASAAGAPSTSLSADATRQGAEPPSLEEELFAHVAAILRKLRPYRKYLPAVLETAFSPVAIDPPNGQPSLRADHLETVSRIISEHGHHEALSPVALQLYWTLYTGVLAFWANDPSPRQEDTLALIDQSLAMFVAWLTGPANRCETTPQKKEG
ncbi:MAG: TetR/AcrR family transcriptional regulator [Pirellulales bacterium]